MLCGVVVALLLAVAPPAQAQTTFKIPFKFESGGKKFPAGDYIVAKAGDGQVTFTQVATAKETVLPFTERLKPPQPSDSTGPTPPKPGPRSSSTRWATSSRPTPSTSPSTWWPRCGCPAQEGYLVHRTKGAHKDEGGEGGAQVVETPRT